jgi:hypothetical protein
MPPLSGSGRGGSRKLIGGQLKLSLLKKFIDVLHNPVDSFEVDGKTYTRDPQFASRSFNVYTTGSGKQMEVFLLHSPTDPRYLEDIVADIGLALNYKTQRVRDEIQKHIEAERKYLPMTDNIITVGYSLGAFVSEEVTADETASKEVYLISRPITFLNFRRVLGDKVVSIKSKLDPVGLLSLFFKSGSKEVVVDPNIKGPLDFFREHLAKVVIGRLEEKGLIEVGKEQKIVGTGKCEKWNKRRVADMKEEVKQLRRDKKVKARNYPISGKNKQELKEMIIELRSI